MYCSTCGGANPSCPACRPNRTEFHNLPPRMVIDTPHKPYGQHVDVVTPFGGGADKMRIGTDANVLSHEIILKGGRKIRL